MNPTPPRTAASRKFMMGGMAEIGIDGATSVPVEYSAAMKLALDASAKGARENLTEIKAAASASR